MPAKRTYKDTVFRDLFGTERNKRYSLELYNALNGTDYRDPSELEITTLRDVIYLSHRNDASFLIRDELVLLEHQSTLDMNMPLRALIYLARLYTAHIEKRYGGLHRRARMDLPRPRLYVLYNGRNPYGVDTLRLSDSYPGDRGSGLGTPGGGIEIEVTVVDVNEERNPAIMSGSGTLAGYARLVALVRGHRDSGLELSEAVSRAIDECIEGGILTDYLRMRKTEVTSMFMTEFDEEKWAVGLRQDGYDEGLEEGLAEGERKGRTEGEQKGRTETRKSFLTSIAAMISSGTLTLEQAAAGFDFTEDEIRAAMN